MVGFQKFYFHGWRNTSVIKWNIIVAYAKSLEKFVFNFLTIADKKTYQQSKLRS